MAFTRFIIPALLFLSLLQPSSPAVPAPGQAGWWRTYFTTPGRGMQPGNPETGLIQAINSSRKSISGAFFDISSPEVIRALIQAKNRGISVKLVTEKNNYTNERLAGLVRNNIPVIPDDKRGLMHNKFAVIDKTLLWTGSYNITRNGSQKNNNNAIMIRSPELAAIFLEEFNEMFEQRIFGNRKESVPFTPLTNKYHVRIEDTDINAYFSPDDNIERIILNRLKKASHSIYFMAFAFTSDSLGEMMIRKHRQGITVKGIVEKRGTGSKYSEFVKMKVEGIPVKQDSNRYAMHHKVIIIDGDLLITGSYNFSKGANKKNDENILIIHNREIAQKYIEEFNRLYR
ncbi:MAG TPA: phospholipase D-like domain-containing protein [Spirochaetota bacterium]|nr:phospholipase D-like domain-containing protein [Spirochaetota bacterium]HPI89101.1 phospholipase D-like domain-containing protein [Spirochaetota bacterium]HPR48855.1 phospholipase D-like domain-containing protein [Spirochaetota bacterium]